MGRLIHGTSVPGIGLGQTTGAVRSLHHASVVCCSSLIPSGSVVLRKSHADLCIGLSTAAPGGPLCILKALTSHNANAARILDLPGLASDKARNFGLFFQKLAWWRKLKCKPWPCGCLNLIWTACHGRIIVHLLVPGSCHDGAGVKAVHDCGLYHCRMPSQLQRFFVKSTFIATNPFLDCG